MAIGFNTLQAGALQVVDKAEQRIAPENAAERAALIATVELIESEVRVVRRRFATARRAIAAPETDIAAQPIRIVAIGASTGGPAALDACSAPCPPISDADRAGAARRRGDRTGWQPGCKAVAGCRSAWCSPANVCAPASSVRRSVSSDGGKRRLAWADDGVAVNHVRPSVNVLFGWMS